MENKAIKNMAYWKKKNNIPGIEALEDSGLTDGRAGSSPFQVVQPNAMPKPPPPPPAAEPLSNGAMSGGVGAASTAIQAKVDAKIDEKVEKAVSGDDGSGLAMKSPMKAGPETKQVDVDDIDKQVALSEHEVEKGTMITGGNESEVINDLEDRIEFLTSDIKDGNTDAKVKAQLKKLKTELARLEGKSSAIKKYKY
tara:strand:- start:51 stop:638 length:588 start_codon:yes stop_codon:yes gene_type:complete